jgi:hypothetical protein
MGGPGWLFPAPRMPRFASKSPRRRLFPPSSAIIGVRLELCNFTVAWFVWENKCISTHHFRCEMCPVSLGRRRPNPRGFLHTPVAFLAVKSGCYRELGSKKSPAGRRSKVRLGFNAWRAPRIPDAPWGALGGAIRIGPGGSGAARAGAGRPRPSYGGSRFLPVIGGDLSTPNTRAAHSTAY